MNRPRVEELERIVAAQQRTIETLMDAAETRDSTTSFAVWQQHAVLARIIDRKTLRLREALDEIRALHASLTEKSAELELAARWQQAIVEALDANVCILDEEGTVIETNAYWGAFAAQHDEVSAAVQAILAGSEETFVLDTPCLGPDGRWFQARVTPLPQFAHGRVMVAYIDVTNLLAAEKALAAKSEEAAMLALVARHTDSAVIIVDPSQRVLWANESFTTQTGYTLAEAVGHRPVQLLQMASESDPVEDRIRGAIAAGHGFAAELRCISKSGRMYPIELEVRPVLDDAGELHRLVGIFRDITRRKEAEARLAQAERLESIGQLAAGIAHEINTPMQYIGDNLTFLQRSLEFAGPVLAALDDPTPDYETARELTRERRFRFVVDRVPRAIAQALEGVQHVSSIVRAMKAFSHLGDGDQHGPTDLNKCADMALTVGRNEWKYVADVETRLAPDLPQIDANAGALNQVILNLLVNAGHAIADVVRGEERGRITVSTCYDEAAREVVLEIADTGSGMPPEVLSRIFDPFFTTKEVGRGTGQGLTLARNIIVKRHGGSIDVASTPGEGTVFTIRLPLAGYVEDGEEGAP